MERVQVRTIEMTWDPEARVAHIWFTAPTEGTGEDAKALVNVLQGWVGEERKPFALMGDGGKLGKLDAAYRKTWADFLKDHKKEALVAFYNQNPFIRVSAEMFRIGTGLNLKSFAKEEEARAWLRKAGIQA
jgi:hypothetical protein